MTFLAAFLFLLVPQFNHQSYQPADPEILWTEETEVEDTDFTIETKEVKYRLDVPYTGKQRKLTEERKALFQLWVKALGLPSEYADLCSSEIEVEAGSKKYWIPIQDSLLEPFTVEAKKGSLLRLWVSYIGNKNKSRIFIVSSYQVLPGNLAAVPATGLQEKNNSLYGFELGKPISEVVNKLGKPDRLIDLEDGSIARAYFSDDHYVIFFSMLPENDLIYSIGVLFRFRQLFGI